MKTRNENRCCICKKLRAWRNLELVLTNSSEYICLNCLKKEKRTKSIYLEDKKNKEHLLFINNNNVE